MTRYYSSTPHTHTRRKRTILESTDENLIFKPSRPDGPFKPTSKTPPPSEAMVEIRPEWGDLNSAEFSAKLEAWHRKHNQ